MSYANNYGARGNANPYDQRGGGVSPGYGSPEFRQTAQYGESASMGRDDYGQNVELAPLAQNGQQFGGQGGGGSRAALDECTSINQQIDKIENEDLPGIRNLQQVTINNPDPSASNSQLDSKASKVMEKYQVLVGQVRLLKSNPQSASLAPVGQVDRRLKAAITSYRTLDSDFQKKLREQMARQYRIVRPDATEAEVSQAVQSNGQQVFSQAMMQSDRRGQSQSALNAVKSRHDEIQKIAEQMEQLAQLFQDMDNLVVEQEAAVTNIEMKGEEVVENMDKGTEQIGVAIQSARNARKWKWWCLGLSILIIIIIVVIVLIVLKPWNNGSSTPKSAKRFALPLEVRRVVSQYTPDIVERVVAPGQPYEPMSKRFRKFQS